MNYHAYEAAKRAWAAAHPAATPAQYESACARIADEIESATDDGNDYFNTQGALDGARMAA